MEPVTNEKIVHHQKQTTKKVQECWSRQNALRTAWNSFADRMFVTSDVDHHVCLLFIPYPHTLINILYYCLMLPYYSMAFFCNVGWFICICWHDFLYSLTFGMQYYIAHVH